MNSLRDYKLVIAIIAAVIAGLAILLAVWWWVPKLRMRGRVLVSHKERADVEDNVRKTMGQALGGAAVLLLVEDVCGIPPRRCLIALEA
jgi:hypothetical protein